MKKSVRTYGGRWPWAAWTASIAVVLAAACGGGNENNGSAGTGGSAGAGTGGTSAAGGSAGASGSGGTSAVGGSGGTGGSVDAGGSGGTGGSVDAGGRGGSGGSPDAGGSGGTGGSLDAGGSDGGPPAPVSVEWSYPGFFTNDFQTVFPTYLARLYYPHPAVTLPFNFVLACATLTNHTSTTQSVDLSVGWPSFATTATETITVPPMGTTTNACLDPVFTWSALDAVTALTPSAVQVEAAITGSGTSLGSATYPFEVMEANGIDWQVQPPATLNDMAELTAVFVRPNDLTVTSVRSDAEKLSMFGDFGIRPFKHTMPTRTWSVSPGAYQTDMFFMEPSETLTVTLNSVTVLGVDGAIEFDLFTYSEYQAWVAGTSTVAEIAVAGATSGTSRSYTASAYSWYVVVMQNPGSNLLARSVSWQRNSTYYDAAYDVAQATFLAVRALGVTYSSIAFSDMTGIQDIRTPANVIANKAGNCIEGSLLFASVAESIGFEPYMHIFFNCSDPSYGHAIFAVRTPGAQAYWPIETTLVGSAATPEDAMNSALTSVNDHASCDRGYDVTKARADNVTPGQ